MKIEDRAWPCMLPFIKRARERRAKEKRFWFVERGSSLHLVVVTSSSLSAGSDAPTHPSDVIPARHQHSCERERARARYDYVTRSVQQPLEPESSSYSFFFRVLQFLKFIREFRRDETRRAYFQTSHCCRGFRLPIRKSILRFRRGEGEFESARKTTSWMKMEGEQLVRFLFSGIKFDWDFD